MLFLPDSHSATFSFYLSLLQSHTQLSSTVMLSLPQSHTQLSSLPIFFRQSHTLALSLSFSFLSPVSYSAIFFYVPAFFIHSRLDIILYTVAALPSLSHSIIFQFFFLHSHSVMVPFFTVHSHSAIFSYLPALSPSLTLSCHLLFCSFPSLSLTLSHLSLPQKRKAGLE